MDGGWSLIVSYKVKNEGYKPQNGQKLSTGVVPKKNYFKFKSFFSFLMGSIKVFIGTRP